MQEFEEFVRPTSGIFRRTFVKIVDVIWAGSIWDHLWHLGSSGSVWGHLEASGSIWQHLAASGLAASGSIRQALEPPATFGSLATSGSIWQHLAASGTIWAPPQSDPTPGAHKSK